MNALPSSWTRRKRVRAGLLAGHPETCGEDTRLSDFDNLFQLSYEPVARAIARVVKDPGRAEELAVETFWRLWQTPAAQGEHTPGWLYRTGVRLALDELRREARRLRHQKLLAFAAAPFASASRTPHEVLSALEEQDRVRAVLAALDGRQAELLLLRHEGLRYEELAKSLGLNPASIGTLLSRAQQAFRKEYVRRYGEPSGRN